MVEGEDSTCSIRLQKPCRDGRRVASTQELSLGQGPLRTPAPPVPLLERFGASDARGSQNRCHPSLVEQSGLERCSLTALNQLFDPRLFVPRQAIGNQGSSAYWVNYRRDGLMASLINLSPLPEDVATANCWAFRLLIIC